MEYERSQYITFLQKGGFLAVSKINFEKLQNFQGLATSLCKNGHQNKCLSLDIDSWSECKLSHSVMSDFLLLFARHICPRNFSGRNTGMGCQFLLQVIFPAQESNSHLQRFLHWCAYSLRLHHLRSTYSQSSSFLKLTFLGTEELL